MRSIGFSRRRRGKSSAYPRFVNYACAHPQCKSGLDVEGHHIIPIKAGGEEKYWNIVALCRICHRRRHFHRDWERWADELFFFKCLQELEILGFVMDERETNLRKNLWAHFHGKKTAVSEPASGEIVALRVSGGHSGAFREGLSPESEIGEENVPEVKGRRCVNPECGKELPLKYPNRKYCSSRCRQSFYNARIVDGVYSRILKKED